MKKGDIRKNLHFINALHYAYFCYELHPNMAAFLSAVWY
ncbi:hypothetical protein T05_847 [Trichinella murrelli]|uniref:Uncharacterized protein n=1 Tax=Trichinella murrelli TaxID=144512 RepID=A0A0V0SSH2_9BILA|nr:hypothetical protein T05_847 [Trichinella murrelli]